MILQCGSPLKRLDMKKVYLLQNTTNLSGSEVISTYVYKVGLEQADFSFGAAADLFNSVIKQHHSYPCKLYSQKEQRTRAYSKTGGVRKYEQQRRQQRPKT